MRALVLHWGRTGGGPRFAAEAVSALHAVDVWTATSWSRQSERASMEPGDADAAFPVDTFRTAAQSVVRSPMVVATAVRLRRFVERARVDCVFAAMEQIWQPAAALALRGTGVPYLLGLHDASYHPGDGGRVQAATRRLELRSADGLLTFSETVGREATAARLMPAARVWSTFLPAVAASASPDRRSSAVVRIGFFGRWQAYKGLAVLVEATRVLRGRTAVPFEVHVHGDGDAAGLIGAADAGVVVHRAWTPEGEVESTISSFDVLVAPYVEASQSGVVPLAAALGVPAVVTPVGGLAEQVQDGQTGLVAGSADVEGVAAALQRIVEDGALRAALARGAAERSRGERSLRRFGEDLRSTMEELMTMGKRR